jgi:hypothetical protein
MDKNRDNLCQKERVLLKFGSNRLIIKVNDQEPFDQDYHNVLYLNNSITNENYFCLAYTLDNTKSSNTINALILYSDSVDLIDQVIREYAVNVSSEMHIENVNVNAKANLKNNQDTYHINEQSKEIDENSWLTQHTCNQCPMQQFIDLCKYLSTLETNDDDNKSDERCIVNNEQEQLQINECIIDIIKKNLNTIDKNYLFECLTEQGLTLDVYEDTNETNQLLIALVFKLCKRKQNVHLINIFTNKNNNSNGSNSGSSSRDANEYDEFPFSIFNLKNYKNKSNSFVF